KALSGPRKPQTRISLSPVDSIIYGSTTKLVPSRTIATTRHLTHFPYVCSVEVLDFRASSNRATCSPAWSRALLFRPGETQLMGVSVVGVFLAGLVSFLSPCVLPLVPGYISMLSGIGVEQLRQDQTPRNHLMSSAIAFVLGFSVVFVTFGASASAVGRFLTHHRSLLVPIAGAVVILFGLQLIGVLVRLNWKVGIALAAVLVALGVAAQMHPGMLGDSFGAVQLYSLALIPLFGPGLAQWMSRDVHFRNLGGTDNKKETCPFAGIVSGFLMGFAFAFGWTPCIGPILATVLAYAATQQNIARGV